MNPEFFARVTGYFEQSIELPPEEQREFLMQVSVGDELLRTELLGMLEHDQKENGFLQDWDTPLRTLVDSAILDSLEANRIPDHIGQYRILRELGRGGMGIVYEGEQSSPKRRVAIKVVSSFGSSELRRRITQEAQALALIEDPGVARIYESGIAEVFGVRTPFIAMELVEGSGIDRWVVENEFSVRDRLVLIARVTDAIQTAHIRGVIHRDLKPSNILVVPERNGPGQPKVLDFGIAQLRSTENTIRSITNSESGPIGTLQYMSPEQFSASDTGADGRSDIYSLGAVAYTVLTGNTPFDLSGFTIAGAASLVASERPRGMGTFNTSLRGDIEIVIAKSMHKDPTRRYQTMEAFGTDLRRILSNKPILARRPSIHYKVGKFALRHRAFTASLGIITALLVVAFVWIGRERGRALIESQTSQAVSGFMVEMLRSIEPNTAQGDEMSVRSVLDDAAKRLDEGELGDQREVNARLRLVIGDIYASLGKYDQAIGQIEQALLTLVSLHGEQDIAVARAYESLAQLEIPSGRYDDAEGHFLKASMILERLGQPMVLISDSGSLGHVYYWTGRFDEAELFFRDSLQALKDTEPSKDARIGHTLSALGSVLENQGKIDQAIEYHLQGVAAQTAFYGPEHTETAEAYNDLGNTLLSANRCDEALSVHLDCLKIRTTLLDPRHPDMAVTMNNLAITYIRLGQPARAIPMLLNAIDIRLETLGRFHQATCSCYGNLARAYTQTGELDTALIAYDEAINAAEQTVGPDHVMAIVFRANRGECLTRMGRYDDAQRALMNEYNNAKRVIGESHFRTKLIAGQLADMFVANGDSLNAEIWTQVAHQNP
tara:strand:- start:4523 stop:7024 length:2502 start_codon:yes stop_codon:yes gene_type:complete